MGCVRTQHLSAADIGHIARWSRARQEVISKRMERSRRNRGEIKGKFRCKFKTASQTTFFTSAALTWDCCLHLKELNDTPRWNIRGYYHQDMTAGSAFLISHMVPAVRSSAQRKKKKRPYEQLAANMRGVCEQWKWYHLYVSAKIRNNTWTQPVPINTPLCVEMG